MAHVLVAVRDVCPPDRGEGEEDDYDDGYGCVKDAQVRFRNDPE